MTHHRRAAEIAFVVLFCLLIPRLGAEPVRLKVTADLANIREKPDIGSAMVLQIPKGAFLEAESKQEEWFKVKFESEGGVLLAGYVHESLVTVLEPPSKPAETKEPEKKAPIKPKLPEKATTEEKTPPSAGKEPEKKPGPLAGQPDAASIPASARVSRFYLVVSGSGFLFKEGDLNLGAEGLSLFYQDLFQTPGNGEFAPLRFGYSASIEFQIPLSGRAWLGIGAQGLFGRRESTIDFSTPGKSATFITRPQVRSVPLSLSLSFYPAGFFFFKFGLEYHFAEIRYLYRLEQDEVWEQWQGKARGQSLGFLGGAGFDFRLSPNLALVLEAAGRAGRVKKFKGTDVHLNSGGLSASEKGFLYLYKGEIGGQAAYSFLFIRENSPSEAGVSDPREATFDLSGVKLSAGIRVKF